MGLTSNILYLISTFQFLHAGFSSYEYYQLMKNLPDVGKNTAPKDIKYETYCALILVILATFLSFNKLEFYPLKGEKKLLSQNEYLKDISLNKATNVDNLMGNDPTGEVTYTPSFIDIHAKRAEVQKFLNKAK